jgi:hypothetical protein
MLMGLLSSTALVAAGGAIDSANAAFFNIGDVMASTGGGTVRDYSADLTTLQHTLNTTLGGLTTGSAFDSSGNFYVTNFTNSNITEFTNSGALAAPNPFTPGEAKTSRSYSRAATSIRAMPPASAHLP